MRTPAELGVFTSSNAPIQLAVEGRMRDLVLKISEGQIDPLLAAFLKKLVDMTAPKLGLNQAYELIEMLLKIVENNRAGAENVLGVAEEGNHEALEKAAAAE